ncbi:MAG: endo-1,4-beta-xylanase [Candidatus Dojkabacteria bacterium]|uniref:Glycosyl hydrolase family 10 n=2 Tax=Candidatus Dojkabacteria TaxID=74243 RepID=A0A136KK16_9BACT|nr:MAG: Glycosyl hydrolase family 10 [candidate division WS6 bacterium OLB21]MBW7953737.1 endo-1,4-beta-xylanase [Candidatus Dojkabacteria bacterium]WKZ27463.1 MAG: endo-1,4-beta-xylanase [Candidatus Dojkabacteria bacterium]
MSKPNKQSWGFTFSHKFALELGLDSNETLAVLANYGFFSEVRLCAYWDTIETSPHEFNFEALDKLVAIAGKGGLKITLAVGRKVPRWPEYHEPDWARNKSREYLEDRAIYFIERVVDRYKDIDHITSWQIENEPLLNFGITDYVLTPEYLRRAVESVRNLDQRPITITVSAEKGQIKTEAELADIVGINIYPFVYDNVLHRYIDQRLANQEYKSRFEKIGKDIIIAELQLEPWGPGSILSMSRAEQTKSMNLQRAEEHIQLAKTTSIETVWIWGIEWWYHNTIHRNDMNIEQLLNLLNKK